MLIEIQSKNIFNVFNRKSILILFSNLNIITYKIIENKFRDIGTKYLGKGLFKLINLNILLLKFH